MFTFSLQVVVALSLAAFLVFGLDKWQANRGWRRVPEAWLLGLSALGGAPGGWLAMSLFRHKTIKRSFRWKMIAATTFLAAFLGLLWFY